MVTRLIAFQNDERNVSFVEISGPFSRVKVKGPCNMDLSKFPMDAQTCSLTYESFNYNNMEVKMRWSRAVPEPVYALKKIILPDFDLIAISTTETSGVHTFFRHLYLFMQLFKNGYLLRLLLLLHLRSYANKINLQTTN